MKEAYNLKVTPKILGILIAVAGNNVKKYSRTRLVWWVLVPEDNLRLFTLRLIAESLSCQVTGGNSRRFVFSSSAAEGLEGNKTKTRCGSKGVESLNQQDKKR